MARAQGTVASWKLQATKSRVRDVKANVDVAGHTVIEKDANSSMVTNWTVAPAGPGSSVTVKTTWQGAGGIGGFFEKTFAPLGLKKIQAEVLDNLKKSRVETSSAGLCTPRKPAIPRTTASAYFCRPSGVVDQRRVGRVLHVAQLDEDRRVLRQVEAGEVGARVQAAGADVGGRRDARGLQLVAHGLRELHRRARPAPALSGGDE